MRWGMGCDRETWPSSFLSRDIPLFFPILFSLRTFCSRFSARKSCGDGRRCAKLSQGLVLRRRRTGREKGRGGTIQWTFFWKIKVRRYAGRPSCWRMVRVKIKIADKNLRTMGYGSREASTRFDATGSGPCNLKAIPVVLTDSWKPR